MRSRRGTPPTSRSQTACSCGYRQLSVRWELAGGAEGEQPDPCPWGWFRRPAFGVRSDWIWSLASLAQRSASPVSDEHFPRARLSLREAPGRSYGFTRLQPSRLLGCGEPSSRALGAGTASPERGRIQRGSGSPLQGTGVSIKTGSEENRACGQRAPPRQPSAQVGWTGRWPGWVTAHSATQAKACQAQRLRNRPCPPAGSVGTLLSPPWTPRTALPEVR